MYVAPTDRGFVQILPDQTGLKTVSVCGSVSRDGCAEVFAQHFNVTSIVITSDLVLLDGVDDTLYSDRVVEVTRSVEGDVVLSDLTTF